MIQTPTQLSQKILEGARQGVTEAIETHRRMGRSIVVMENGVITEIKAKDIAPKPLPNDELE